MADPRSQPNSELDHFDDHEKLRIALAQREIAEARIEELEGALHQIDSSPATATPVCCYCDADLSCARCGREQPATSPTAHSLSSPATTTLLPCPFCGSSSVDPEGWMSCEPDGSDKRTGPACDDCGASAASDERWNTRDWTPGASLQPAHTLNQQAAEHPPFDNPRDPFASPERIPSVGGDAVAATPTAWRYRRRPR